MKRSILAVLVNYGDEQLKYLQKVVNELKSFKKYDVTVLVHSNIELPYIKGIDKVHVIEMENYQLLPLTCRSSIWTHREEFDIYLFGENDHLFRECHVDRYLEYVDILPADRIAGLIQYEENETGKYYPAYHGSYEWDYDSVEVYGDKKFAHFSNLHQATFILTKDQISKIGEQYDFTQFFGQSHYSVKCRVNTDVFQFCGMKKMICISDFEDNLIHHLPNIYINGDAGRAQLGHGDNKMKNAITKLKN